VRHRYLHSVGGLVAGAVSDTWGGAKCASAGAIAGADVVCAVMSVGVGQVGAWAAVVIRAEEYCAD
jgi:hypothetical protein